MSLARRQEAASSGGRRRRVAASGGSAGSGGQSPCLKWQHRARALAPTEHAVQLLDQPVKHASIRSWAGGKATGGRRRWQRSAGLQCPQPSHIRSCANAILRSRIGSACKPLQGSHDPSSASRAGTHAGRRRTKLRSGRSPHPPLPGLRCVAQGAAGRRPERLGTMDVNAFSGDVDQIYVS